MYIKVNELDDMSHCTIFKDKLFEEVDNMTFTSEKEVFSKKQVKCSLRSKSQTFRNSKSKIQPVFVVEFIKLKYSTFHILVKIQRLIRTPLGTAKKFAPKISQKVC